jgi:AmmeMemoRadiSam system protein B
VPEPHAARWVRPPAVAGTFYPDDPDELEATVDSNIQAAGARSTGWPKAIIAPHAGYVYSGPIAGSAYARVRPAAGIVRRVVLAGPCHRVPVRGIAVSSAAAFGTPLGPVPVDAAGRDAALTIDGVAVGDDAHELEHSLEVHLPFIQRVLGDVTLVPLVVGAGPPSILADVLDVLWDGDETLIIVSTDLSHYHDDATAKRLDRATADAIVGGRVDAISSTDACGAAPVRGLLVAAARHGLSVELLDLRTSADTAGTPDRVVGYGAFAVA